MFLDAAERVLDLGGLRVHTWGVFVPERRGPVAWRIVASVEYYASNARLGKLVVN